MAYVFAVIAEEFTKGAFEAMISYKPQSWVGEWRDVAVDGAGVTAYHGAGYFQSCINKSLCIYLPVVVIAGHATAHIGQHR